MKTVNTKLSDDFACSFYVNAVLSRPSLSSTPITVIREKFRAKCLEIYNSKDDHKIQANNFQTLILTF